MKTLLCMLILALTCSSAFALTIGFRAYSTAGEAQTEAPAFCDVIAASNIQPSGMIEGPVSITRLTFATYTSVASFTPGTFDYKIKCTKASTGAAAIVRMFFNTESTTYFPISNELLRFR
jgi:hypothetical protein